MKSDKDNKDLQIQPFLFRERVEFANRIKAMQELDLETQYKTLIKSFTKAKPNDRSPKDRDFAVAITKLQEAYAWYNTYCK